MLYRTSRSTPLFTLRSEIDRLFEDTLGADTRRAWMPVADVRERTDGYVFELELPGVAPESVEVSAESGVLTIRGEKAQRTRKEGEDERYHVGERGYGSFIRAFQLPQGVDEEHIEAESRHGVLTIRVPKAQRPAPRKIRIASPSGEQPREVHDARAAGNGPVEAGAAS